jgi:hypothetical protein
VFTRRGCVDFGIIGLPVSYQLRADALTGWAMTG